MRRILSALLICLLLSGCARIPKTAAPSPAPAAAPFISVWDTQAGALIHMDIESYVAGVVAGEMPSDWPLEALKAQAILARTFVLKFITEKESRYPGADISTDIAEAQAYNADAVNARILTATAQTRGLILLDSGGALPYAWFHAHSGGKTALACESLDWQGAEPSHTRTAEGLDSPKAPASARAWSAAFTEAEFLSACRDAGYHPQSCRELHIAETGPSGRAVIITVDGVPMNAARLRISLGSTRMRSTLLTSLHVSDGMILMEGLGYGHGVGMPQWGAYALAEAGRSGEEIALHYYNGLHLYRAW